NMKIDLCIYLISSDKISSIDYCFVRYIFFFFQAEDGIRDRNVTGVQTCALPIWKSNSSYYEGFTNDDGTQLIPTEYDPEKWKRRSEERRVGKECRCWWKPDHKKKKR